MLSGKNRQREPLFQRANPDIDPSVRGYLTWHRVNTNNKQQDKYLVVDVGVSNLGAVKRIRRDIRFNPYTRMSPRKPTEIMVLNRMESQEPYLHCHWKHPKHGKITWKDSFQDAAHQATKLPVIPERPKTHEVRPSAAPIYRPRESPGLSGVNKLKKL